MTGLRLYVGSLPYAAQKLEIEQLFADDDLTMSVHLHLLCLYSQ